MIIFSKKEGHVYKNLELDTTYTSVTTLIKKYSNEFDSNYWSTYKALEVIVPNFKFRVKLTKGVLLPIMMQLTPSEKEQLLKEKELILLRWSKKNKDSLDKGTDTHYEKESISYEQGFEVNPFTSLPYKVFDKPNFVYENQSLCENLYDLPDGFYPELLIWSHKYKVAGQSDKVFIETIGKNRFIDIDDYKTNIAIKKTSFYSRQENKNQMMKAPLDELMDCNYIHYTIQLSTYAYMLSQMGFIIRNIGITHIKEDEDKLYTLEYKHREVKAMLEHFSSTEIKTSSVKPKLKLKL